MFVAFVCQTVPNHQQAMYAFLMCSQRSNIAAAGAKLFGAGGQNIWAKGQIKGSNHLWLCFWCFIPGVVDLPLPPKEGGESGTTLSPPLNTMGVDPPPSLDFGISLLKGEYFQLRCCDRWRGVDPPPQPSHTALGGAHRHSVAVRLRQVAKQIFGAGGKRLRPVIVFLVARATTVASGMGDLLPQHRRCSFVLPLHTQHTISKFFHNYKCVLNLMVENKK